jgi:hypothetical protein
MKTFIEVLTMDGQIITIAVDKIAYVIKNKEERAVVYLIGPINQNTGIAFSLNMKYEDFISKLS